MLNFDGDVDANVKCEHSIRPWMRERSLEKVPAGGRQSGGFVNAISKFIYGFLGNFGDGAEAGNFYWPQTKLREGNVFMGVCTRW